MQEILNARKEIDQIHQELARLFKQRLQLAHQIWQLKKVSQMPMVDLNREEQIVHAFDGSTLSENEKMVLQSFFKNILLETKKYIEAEK